MILHSLIYGHPALHDHIEVWHPTKELSDRHERQLKKQNVRIISNTPVEVPTDQGREVLATWLNARHVFPEDQFSKLQPHDTTP